MEAILVKVFATALALSQVMTRPDAVKVQFDPIQDQTEVVQLLRDGCTHMRKAFDIENLDLDDLISTAMTDTQAMPGEPQTFHGIKFADLFTAYREICKSETVEHPVIEPGEVIAFYNNAVANLPDHARLKGLKLPGLTQVYDANGAKYAELFEPDHRRISVPLADVPGYVQNAFVSAEDKRFFKHHGVDERSVIRAFMNTMANSGRQQGGSTITQQVVKNLLVGDSLSYERKIREIIVATRVEQTMSKQEILELYLNTIYLGRGAWGIEMAAQTYFGHPAKDLTLAEGAFLAGLTKGPNYYSPDRHRDRAQERFAYVLQRMQDDGAISEQQAKDAQSTPLALIANVRPRRDNGFHFVDNLGREAKAMANIGSLTAASYAVKTTIRQDLQRATESALQDGLARYEQRTGRVSFSGAEANLADAIKRIEADPKADHSKPSWLVALLGARPPLYDVHWAPAVVVERTTLKGGFDSIHVGLRDGRILPLSTYGSRTRQVLGINDLVYVNVVEGGKQGIRVELRSRPKVQGAAVVLENKTGRILAMAGGFSYPASQLNRTTQTRRQPGSSFKPVTYLAALAGGLQPNTLIDDGPITLPPIGNTRYATDKDYWSPKNYDGGGGGTTTMRRALENSKNLATTHLLEGGVAYTPEASLDKICQLALEEQLYTKCERYYPFILGAQPVRLLDMAAFYASIANEGPRPTPYGIDEIDQNGQPVYQHSVQLASPAGADKVAFYQLKTMLQGVVARGTARSIGALSPYVGGKTGTSDDENDAWFVGFSNDVTIAVWVGYDNSGPTRRTLGPGQTGGHVAVPIFEPIMQAVWTMYAPRTPLRGPSPEAQRHLIALPIDLQSGQRLEARTPGAFTEYFRLDAQGHLTETQDRLSGGSYSIGTSGFFSSGPFGDNPFFGGRGLFNGGTSEGPRDYGSGPTVYQRPGRDEWRRDTDMNNYTPSLPPPQSQPLPPPQQDVRPRTRRAGPGYFWGTR